MRTHTNAYIFQNGNMKNNLGNNDVYKCNVCGNISGRDVNAARNILIRNMVHLIKNLEELLK